MKGPDNNSNFKDSCGLNFVGLFQFDEGIQKAKPFCKSEDEPFYNQRWKIPAFSRLLAIFFTVLN